MSWRPKVKTGKETSQRVGKSKVALAVKHKKANSRSFIKTNVLAAAVCNKG